MEFINYDNEKLKNEEMIERLIKEHLKIKEPLTQENMKKLLIYLVLN